MSVLDRARSACQRIALLLAAGAAFSLVANRSFGSTVALWLFDDPAGSSVAVDSSGNNRDLTIGPGAAIVPSGRFGNALDASAGSPDGIGAFRDQVDSALNPANTSWTLECWVKAKPGFSGDNRIWGIAGENYIAFGRPQEAGEGINVANIFLPTSAKWQQPTGTLTDGAWHHIAVVYDAKAATIAHFFDGKLKYSVPFTKWRAVPFDLQLQAVFPPQYPQLQIGWRDSVEQWGPGQLQGVAGPPKRFDGLIDEMRFSNEALYHSEFQPPQSFASSFLRVWPRELSFVVQPDKGSTSEAAPSRVVSLSSVGRPIHWRLHSSEPWIKTSLTEGSASNESAQLQVTAEATSLDPGEHQGVLQITPDGSAQESINVTVKVAVAPADSVRTIGDRRQLFLDRRFIESDSNVRLTVNQPEKVTLNFPFENDRPLEPSNIFYVKEIKKWRMYYNALGQGNSLRFAESDDGITWKAPETNAVVHGSRNEPLIMGGVMYDEHDVPEKRFKAFNEQRGKQPANIRGIYAYYSADGIHFEDSGRVLPMPAELFVDGFWDARIKKYVMYLRVENLNKGINTIGGSQILKRPDHSVDGVTPDQMMEPGYENLRSIGRVETDDPLKPWPFDQAGPPTIYTTASNLPMVLDADSQDGFVDFYISAAWQYPYADDVYLAFPAAFRHFHPSREPTFNKYDDANGPIEVQLATSRDGIKWDRPTRSAYLPMGTTNEPDRWLNMMGTSAVRNGDYLYQYYWSTGRLHDSALLRPELEGTKHTGMIFAAKQRLDGFVSADVDDKGGWLTTPPIQFTGNRLLVNQDCNATGTIYVELRDLNDVPIPGYRLGECEEITCNDTAWEVRWRNHGADVSALAGMPVKIHFKMRNSKLYAFEFTSSAASQAPIQNAAAP